MCCERKTKNNQDIYFALYTICTTTTAKSVRLFQLPNLQDQELLSWLYVTSDLVRAYPKKSHTPVPARRRYILCGPRSYFETYFDRFLRWIRSTPPSCGMVRWLPYNPIFRQCWVYSFAFMQQREFVFPTQLL